MMTSRSPSRSKEIRSRRGKKSVLGRILYLALGAAMVMGLLAVVFAVGTYFYFTGDLPKISSLKDYSPPVITTVYSDDKRKIGEFFEERRVIVPYDNMPEKLII